MMSFKTNSSPPIFAVQQLCRYGCYEEAKGVELAYKMGSFDCGVWYIKTHVEDLLEASKVRAKLTFLYRCQKLSVDQGQTFAVLTPFLSYMAG